MESNNKIFEVPLFNLWDQTVFECNKIAEHTINHKFQYSEKILEQIDQYKNTILLWDNFEKNEVERMKQRGMFESHTIQSTKKLSFAVYDMGRKNCVISEMYTNKHPLCPIGSYFDSFSEIFCIWKKACHRFGDMKKFGFYYNTRNIAEEPNVFPLMTDKGEVIFFAFSTCKGTPEGWYIGKWVISIFRLSLSSMKVYLESLYELDETGAVVQLDKVKERRRYHNHMSRFEIRRLFLKRVEGERYIL